MLPEGKFDGARTMPAFELDPADAGSPPPPPPPPFGSDLTALHKVACPLGRHMVKVVRDAGHLRYVTHWHVLGGHTFLCLTSARCTAEFDAPRTGLRAGARVARPAVCECAGEGAGGV